MISNNKEKEEDKNKKKKSIKKIILVLKNKARLDEDTRKKIKINKFGLA